MGQKANPIGNRLGYIKGWESNWCGGRNYADRIQEDAMIRKYLFDKFKKASLSRIIIERTLKFVTIHIFAVRPGIIIGKGGGEVDKLKEELRKIAKKDVHVDILDVNKPELDAKIVADSIAQQIQARVSFKRAVRMAISSTMKAGAHGIKVSVSGRINGAEMARTEHFKDGSIPLHTFRADIDYYISEALTKYGLLGIKVWIHRGEVYGKRDLSIFGDQKKSKKKFDQPRERRKEK